MRHLFQHADGSEVQRCCSYSSVAPVFHRLISSNILTSLDFGVRHAMYKEAGRGFAYRPSTTDLAEQMYGVPSLHTFQLKFMYGLSAGLCMDAHAAISQTRHTIHQHSS